MNEEAFSYAYELFKKDGYTDSVDDFRSLIQTDNDAFDYAYDLFKQDGYTDSKEAFNILVSGKQEGVQTAAVAAAPVTPEELIQPPTTFQQPSPLLDQKLPIGVASLDQIESQELARGKELSIEGNKRIKSINKSTPEVEQTFIASIDEEINKAGLITQKNIEAYRGGGSMIGRLESPQPYIASEVEPTSDKDLEEFLGQDKFNIYKQYQKDGSIDMGLVEELFPNKLNNIVREEKRRKAANYATGLTPEERELMNRFVGEDIDYEYAKQEKKKKQDEKDYFEATGKILNQTQILNDRKYEPSTGSLIKMGLIEQVPIKTKEAFEKTETNKIKADQELLVDDIDTFSAKAKEFDNLYGPKIKALNKLGNDIEAFGDPQKDPDAYNSMVNEFEAIRLDLNSVNTQEMSDQLVAEQDAIRERSLALSERAGLIDDVSILAEATSKNYNNIDRTLLMMKKSFGGAGAVLGTGILNTAVTMAKAEDTPFTVAVDRLYQDAIDYNKEIDKEIEGLSRTIELKDVQFDDVSAVDYLFQMLANNSPSISAALATGPLSQLGLPAQAVRNLLQATFFTMEAGGKLSELEIAQRNAPQLLGILEQQYEDAQTPAERKIIEQQISETQDLLDAGQLKKMFVASTYGGVASFAERFGTLSYVNNINKFLNVTRGNVLQKGLKTVGNVGFNTGTELVEEGFTQMTHNFIDIAAMGEDKSIFEGLDEDFVANVALSSIAIQGPSISMNLSGMALEELSSIDDKKEFVKKRNKLVSLDAEIREINEDRTYKIQGEARKNILEERRTLARELILDYGIAVNDKLGDTGITMRGIQEKLAIGRRTGDYSKFNEMTDLAWQKRKVLKEISKHELEGGDTQADIRYGESLQAKYTELNERHSRLASRKKQEELEKLQQGYKTKDGTVIPYQNIAQRQRSLAIFRLNRNIASNTIENAKPKKGVQKPKYVEFDFMEITANAKLSKEEKEAAIINKIKEWAQENNRSGNFAQRVLDGYDQGSNGIYEQNTAVVFTDLIVGQIYDARVSDLDSRVAAVAPVHELLHAYNKENNITDEGILKSIDGAVKGLEDFISEKWKQGAITDDQRDYFEARKKMYSGEASKNEELVNLVNDLIAAKILSRNQFTELFQLRTAINKINNFFIGEAYDYSFIETGQQLFNYISTFQKVTRDQALKMTGTPEERDEEELRRSLGAQIELTEEESEKLNEAVKRANTAYLEEKRDNREVREAKAEALSLVEGDLFATTEALFDIYSVKTDGKFEIEEDKAVEIAYNWDNEIQRRLNTSSDPRFEYYRDSPAFDNEIVEEIASTTIMGTENRPSQSIKGLIESYDGSVPINAWINKYINNKIVDVINNAFPILAGKEARTDETVEKYARSFREEAEETSFEDEDISAAAEQNRKTKINVTPGLIDPRKILPEGLLEEAEKAIKPQVEKLNLEELSLKTLTDLATDVTADFFSVRDRTLYEKKLNLNRKEMASAQETLKDIGFQKLIDLLPFATVPMVAGGDKKITVGEAEKMISSELIGTSTGVANNIVKKFYESVGRVRTAAGLPEKIKKENLTPADMAEALGMDIDGKVINSDPRSPTGQNIKGMMELVGRLITNKIVREELADDAEYKTYVANIYAGVSPLMASMGALAVYEYDYREILAIKELTEEFKKQYPNSKYTLDFTNVYQLQSARNAFQLLINSFSPEDVIKYILPTISSQYGLIGKALAADSDGQLINVFSETVEDPEKVGIKRTRYFLTQGRADFFKNFFEDAKYERGAKEVTINGKTYPTVPNSFANKQNTKGFLSGKVEKELGARFEFNQDQRQGLETIVNKLKELLDDKKISANDVGMIMKTFNASTNALVRTAATLTSYTELSDEQKEVLTDADFDYEHTKPARVVIGQLLEYIAGKDVTFESIMDDYNAAIILESQHKAVNKFYKAELPKKGANKRYTHTELEKYLKENNIPLIDLVEFEGIGELKASAGAVLESNRKAYNEAFPNEAKTVDTNDQIIEKFKKTDNQRIKTDIKASKGANLGKDFNLILQRKHGIRFNKKVTDAEARLRSAQKPNYRFWIPPSADDFMGLLYYTLPKGKQGEEAIAFYKKYLLDPFSIGERAIDQRIVQMSADYKKLKKDLKVRAEYLAKKNTTGFTNEQSMRMWMFNNAGHEVPGLTKKELRENLKLVNDDPSLLALGKGIIKLTKLKEYTKPSKNWVGGTIANDMFNISRGEIRQKYLEKWQANADEIFTENTLNKLEYLYGIDYVISLKDSLRRMKEGRNRKYVNSQTERVFDYLNGSTATIMFFNTRSALLQTISAINFINWSDNNPLKAGEAFANQQQYWKDFMRLMNSDYLVARRAGLKINVSEAELAEIVNTTRRNKIQKLINKLLRSGYAPTQFADSLAIASGGATFYRNRLETYIKQGLSEKEAEEKAFNDFRDISEESQQSSRPDKISMQQADTVGRVILNFANTPMQYARISKKAALDLLNNRGDWKTNTSKILYYTFVQNLIFNTIQSAVWALMFGTDEDEDDEKIFDANINIANGMANSILRGLGIYGATGAMVKDVALKIYKEYRKKERGERGEYSKAVFEVLNIAPPLDSKVSKIRGALFAADRGAYEDLFDEGYVPESKYLLPTAKVFSAVLNIPLDRVYIKYKNIEGAMGDDLEAWQRVAQLAGWEAWQLGIDETKKPFTQEDYDKALTKYLKSK